MKELLHLEQHNEFPKKFYGLITNLPGTNSLNIINYEDNINSITNYKINFPFYFGIIPQTYIEYSPLFFIFFSDKKFDVYTKIELEPVLFFKIPKLNIINIIYSKISGYSLEINKENIENILKEFFEVDSIVKLAKSESMLENSNNEYHKKFIKIYKKS